MTREKGWPTEEKGIPQNRGTVASSLRSRWKIGKRDIRRKSLWASSIQPLASISRYGFAGIYWRPKCVKVMDAISDLRDMDIDQWKWIKYFWIATQASSSAYKSHYNHSTNELLTHYFIYSTHDYFERQCDQSSLETFNFLLVVSFTSFPPVPILQCVWN